MISARWVLTSDLLLLLCFWMRWTIFSTRSIVFTTRIAALILLKPLRTVWKCPSSSALFIQTSQFHQSSIQCFIEWRLCRSQLTSPWEHSWTVCFNELWGRESWSLKTLPSSLFDRVWTCELSVEPGLFKFKGFVIKAVSRLRSKVFSTKYMSCLLSSNRCQRDTDLVCDITRGRFSKIGFAQKFPKKWNLKGCNVRKLVASSYKTDSLEQCVCCCTQHLLTSVALYNPAASCITKLIFNLPQPVLHLVLQWGSVHINIVHICIYIFIYIYWSFILFCSERFIDPFKTADQMTRDLTNISSDRWRSRTLGRSVKVKQERH